MRAATRELSYSMARQLRPRLVKLTSRSFVCQEYRLPVCTAVTQRTAAPDPMLMAGRKNRIRAATYFETVRGSQISDKGLRMHRGLTRQHRCFHGGGGGIRTHGRGSPYSDFQDRRLQPLGHPSLGLLYYKPNRGTLRLKKSHILSAEG
jgi:hypothetical protein